MVGAVDSGRDLMPASDGPHTAPERWHDRGMRRPIADQSLRLLLLGFALAAIFLAEVRSHPGAKWAFVLLFLATAGRDVWRDYRRGFLTAPIGALHRRRPRVGAIQLLSTVCGSLALVLII